MGAVTPEYKNDDDFVGQDNPQKWCLKDVLIGDSLSIRNVRRAIEMVAKTSTTTLIQGESGTGKELVARSIHQLSKRASRSFVAINCGAIPAELLESELFGHEKGSFTGALTTRIGRFEMAHGGTLFLDEVGDMPLTMQVKLLRVLQERVIERVGGSKSIPVDVRIVAATNCNIEEMVKKGSFREDLYFRLNVFPVNVPPLRARRTDIPVLVETLIEKISKGVRDVVSFTEGAMSCLTKYHWQGNVRELANFVERMYVTHEGRVIDEDDIPDRYRVSETTECAASQSVDIGSQTMDDIEKSILSLVPLLAGEPMDMKAFLGGVEVALIRETLRYCNDNIAEAGRMLALKRTTLLERMKRHGILDSMRSASAASTSEDAC